MHGIDQQTKVRDVESLRIRRVCAFGVKLKTIAKVWFRVCGLRQMVTAQVRVVEHCHVACQGLPAAKATLIHKTPT